MASPKQLAALAKARQALARKRQPRGRLLDPASAAAIFGLPMEQPSPRRPRTQAERLRHGHAAAWAARKLGFGRVAVRAIQALVMREK